MLIINILFWFWALYLGYTTFGPQPKLNRLAPYRWLLCISVIFEIVGNILYLGVVIKTSSYAIFFVQLFMAAGDLVGKLYGLLRFSYKMQRLITFFDSKYAPETTAESIIAAIKYS